MVAPALSSLAELVPHEGLLTSEELEDVAGRIGAERGIWEPLVRVDGERRRFELIYEDERMDAWVLSWMPGQGTGFHDHDISSVGLSVASGCVREDLMVYGREHQSRSLRPGDTRQGGP